MNTTNTTNTKKSTIEVTENTREDGGTELKLTFSHGVDLVLDPANLSEEVRHKALLHGLKQKLVDAAAISRDPSTGREASVETKFQAVTDVYERLMSGEWNKRREGGGAGGGLLFQALVRRYAGKKTETQIKEWLEVKSDKEKAALRKNPEIAKIIDEIRAEKGDENAGADLLAELED